MKYFAAAAAIACLFSSLVLALPSRVEDPAVSGLGVTRLRGDPTVVGQLRPLPSGLTVSTLLGSKRIPVSARPDVVGAFRFLCGAGQIRHDDPIVYPGQPGAAHLHQFFGNLDADAHSTYASLRQSGDSTCMNALNRSAYWMPAMLDGKGNVVRPDYVSIYYKRRPASDPQCHVSGKGCVGIPVGLRMVFGWDQSRPDEPQPENSRQFEFKCIEHRRVVGSISRDMVEPMSVCGPGRKLMATIHTPLCWDGVNLAAPDHRSHLAYMSRNAETKWVSKCPDTHPYIIPQFTMNVRYTIAEGDDPKLWHLSSDHMIPAAIRKPGASFHSDYFEAWEDKVRLRWEAGCLDGLLNCSDGDLGDGQIMKRGPYYPHGVANPRLVRMPEHESGQGPGHAH